jgi:hypothetical protein
VGGVIYTSFFRSTRSIFFSVCDAHTFGVRCSSSCGNCSRGDICHHTNGTCPRGCDVGVYGERCQERKFLQNQFNSILLILWWYYNCLCMLIEFFMSIYIHKMRKLHHGNRVLYQYFTLNKRSIITKTVYPFWMDCGYSC